MANTKQFNKLFHDNIRKKHLFSPVGLPIYIGVNYTCVNFKEQLCIALLLL